MENFCKSIKQSRGFSLLEVLFAIFILTIGIVGAFTAFGGMLASSSTVKEKLTAAYLAQEGVEIVRNIRDTSWLQHTGTAGWTYALDYFTTNTYGHNCQGTSAPTPTGYNGGCEADYLTGTASEGTDHVLNQITTAPSYARPALYIDSTNNFYAYNPTVGTPTIFRRQIIVNPKKIQPSDLSDNVLDIIVNVYWQERGQNYNFPVEAFLYNWNE